MTIIVTRKLDTPTFIVWVPWTCHRIATTPKTKKLFSEPLSQYNDFTVTNS